MYVRDVIFRKMTNQNQTDTNEMATTETKYQTDFYSAEKIPILNLILTLSVLKMPINTKKIPRKLGQKYQIPIWFGYFLGIPNFWLPIVITNVCIPLGLIHQVRSSDLFIHISCYHFYLCCLVVIFEKCEREHHHIFYVICLRIIFFVSFL